MGSSTQMSDLSERSQSGAESGSMSSCVITFVARSSRVSLHSLSRSSIAVHSVETVSLSAAPVSNAPV